MPEAGVRVLALHRRNPAGAVRVLPEDAVAEVRAQQAELPQVVGDVLAHVGHRAVRANNDLRVRIGLALRNRLSARPPHHPAAGVLACGFLVQHATVHHDLARPLPEMQMKNLALAWQKVVGDVQPLHGLQVPRQHRRRQQVGDLCRLALAVFQGMQCVQAQRAPRILLRGVFVVPLRHAGVQVPQKIVDALPVRRELQQQRMRPLHIAALQMLQPHHHVRHLHTGVVDVVLYADLPAWLVPVGPQHAGEAVAQDRVA